MRPRRSALTIVAMSCALLASAARPMAAQGPADPCAEVTQAQVTTALGMPVGPAQKINDSACQYPATGANAAKNIRLTVQFLGADQFDKIKAGQVPGLERAPITGVGDDAFSQSLALSTNVPRMTTLFVKKGHTMVTVRVYGVPDAAKQLAAEKAVAQAVVSKI
jgi:hypothetical protein